LNCDNGPGELYFIDSNIFLYAKIMDGEYGAACAEVLRKIEDNSISAGNIYTRCSGSRQFTKKVWTHETGKGCGGLNLLT
jgi:hypothetical protein